MARAWLWLSGLLVAGCSYANVSLNDGAVLLENRVKNRTRAETFADMKPTRGSATPDLVEPQTEIRKQPQPTTDQPQVVDADGFFVGLALSGGGSRSANFSAACMFQLERIGLLQKVDYISSVSGGSLPAAYYCLNRAGWNPKEVQDRLSHGFATDMLIQTLLPWNSLALTFTDYDRSDLLAKTLNDNLFTRDGHHQTYADLLPDRPRLLLNSTDLQSGRRFVFCNETFDGINSDLSKYPIAYAVAASSSVPVVLHEVTLRDYSSSFEQYRHLIDGGIGDNLGIQTLVETYRAQVEAARDRHQPDPYPRGAVFIVIDARVQYDQDISSKSDTGFVRSLTTAAGLSTASLLSRASSATLDDVVLKNAPDKATVKDIRDALTQLNEEGYVEFDNIGKHRIRVAHMALTQLGGIDDLPYSSFSESVNSTSTYFNIDRQRAAQLYTAADLLMRDRFEQKLSRLVTEMNGPTTKPSQ